MNCWKTINFTRQYGSQRLFILSALTMLFTFILLYIPATYLFVATTFYDNHFIYFILALILLYPAHKLLHFLPIAHLNEKVRKTVDLKFGFIPTIKIQITEPIKKYQFLIALLSPFVIINSVLLAACFLFPHYAHYFTILIAYHIGMSVSDLICGKDVITAPKNAFIEENEDGYEILIINKEGTSY
ncbi:DUF3267 domain-containing protein [Robertmurraya sp. GLU-23]